MQQKREESGANTNKNEALELKSLFLNGDGGGSGSGGLTENRGIRTKIKSTKIKMRRRKKCVFCVFFSFFRRLTTQTNPNWLRVGRSVCQPLPARSIQNTIYLCILHNVCACHLPFYHTRKSISKRTNDDNHGGILDTGYSQRCGESYHNTHTRHTAMRSIGWMREKFQKAVRAKQRSSSGCCFFPVTNLIIVRIKNKLEWDHKKRNASGKVSERSI